MPPSNLNADDEIEPNPYQASSSSLDVDNDDGEWELAGKGRRFLTFVLDYVGFVIIVAIIVTIMAMAGSLNDTEPMVINLLAWFGYPAYYVVFESLFGRTPGKFICRTKVVDAFGEKPGLLRVMGRTLCRFIPFEPLSILWNDQPWHDSMSGTSVVCRTD